MKTLKLSNIILISFLITIIIKIIAEVNYSTYQPLFNGKNAVYTELKIDKTQNFKYLFLKGYRDVTYEVKSGKKFKIEVFTDPRNSDSCKTYFSNDTLYLNIINNEGYTMCTNTPDVKICIPTVLNEINANKVYCKINGFHQDTLNIYVKSTYIDLNDCKINTVNCKGYNSGFRIFSTNNIEKLNLKDIKNSSVELNDVIIKNFIINQDSNRVILSGKAIDYYLNK